MTQARTYIRRPSSRWIKPIPGHEEWGDLILTIDPQQNEIRFRPRGQGQGYPTWRISLTKVLTAARNARRSRR